jgi:sec-independent protein translocase protein TatA
MIPGAVELLILLAIILLFFGATRVPQLGRSLGQSLKEFREGTKEDSNDEAKLRERAGDKGALPRQGEDGRFSEEVGHYQAEQRR